MLMRLAFFEGAIRPGCEDQFEDTVKTKLLPIWKQTPRAVRVDVLLEVEADEGAHRFPMVLAIAYPDRNALEEALASPVRGLGREATRELFELFDGRIFHAVYEV